MLKAGTIGQVRGPFVAGAEVIEAGKMIVGISIPVEVLNNIQGGLFFEVNNNRYKMNKKGMYEIDSPMYISSIRFPNGAPNEVKIDYRVYE